MNSLNSIIVEGNVVKTPEIRQTPKGTPVCTVGVAVNRWYKGVDGELQKEVSFFDVDTWGQLAKACSETCQKGRGIRVVGRLKAVGRTTREKPSQRSTLSPSMWNLSRNFQEREIRIHLNLTC